MTETELNEKIRQIETERYAQLPQTLKRHTGQRYRREKCVQKNDRLMKIISRHYIPHAGYIDYDFKGETLLHSGKYIKYPRTSNSQRWMKHATSHRVRNCEDIPLKGNFYRRLFDYWWTLY